MTLENAPTIIFAPIHLENGPPILLGLLVVLLVVHIYLWHRSG